MKRLLVIITCTVLCAGNALCEEGKVGYVDIDRVTAKAKAVNQAMTRVEGKVRKFKDDIEAKKKKHRDLQAEIKKIDGVLSDDEINMKKKEVSTLSAEMDELDISARREMQKLDAEFFEPMLKKIIFAIQDVAKEQNYDIIVRGEAVLYGKSSVDITDEVIRQLNVDDGESTSTETSEPRKPSLIKKKETPDTEPAPSATPDNKPSAAAPPVEAKPVAPAATRSTAEKIEETPAAKPSPTRAAKRPVDRQPD